VKPLPTVGVQKRKSNSHFANSNRSYGTNILPERRYKSFLTLLLDALKDTTLIILIIAAFISLILGIAFPDTADGETRATGK
jgi:magnesium-transporting ATPase (P-type)